MNTVLIAIICHLVTTNPLIKDCAEYRVTSTFENEAVTFIGCQIIGQQIIADWKSQTKYADESYTVEGWKCADSQYKPKGRV